MSMLPKSRDNWLIDIKKYNANPFVDIHIPIFNSGATYGGKSENETICDHGYRGHSGTIEPIIGLCANIGDAFSPSDMVAVQRSCVALGLPVALTPDGPVPPPIDQVRPAQSKADRSALATDFKMLEARVAILERIIDGLKQAPDRQSQKSRAMVCSAPTDQYSADQARRDAPAPCRFQTV